MVSVSWYYPAVVTSGIVEWAASLCAGLSAVLRLSRDMAVPPVEMFIGLLATGCVATLSPVLGGPAGADDAQKMAENFLAQANGPRPMFHSWRKYFTNMYLISVFERSLRTTFHVTGVRCGNTL